MKNRITSQPPTCETCKHRDKDVYEPPCCDCVDSKRWIKFDPKVNYTKWEPRKDSRGKQLI